jgi:hypothetical protein
MTIGYLLDNIKTMDEGPRASVMHALMPNLSGPSRETLLEFQRDWDFDNKTFAEFREAQDEWIIVCLKKELSVLGAAVRQKHGLPPINRETEIDCEASSCTG